MADTTAPPDTTPDPDITLAHGDLRLRVSPYGASLRGFWREGEGGDTEIVTAYHGRDNKVGGQGDVLIPFPGRIKAGAYTFEGVAYQLEKTDREGPNAIHGFLRHTLWETVAQGDDFIMFRTDLVPTHDGYPFALRAAVTYGLDASGMTCNLEIQNTGTQTAPVAAGFHPYFTVGGETINDTILHLPMASTLEFVDMIPTGRVLPVDGTPFDFRTPRPIGETVFNTCFLNPQRKADGRVHIRLSHPTNARTLTLWMDAAFDYLVVYSGDPLPPAHRRRSLALEPMTCGSDAFNHPEWGLVALAPGETLSGEWGVSV